MIGDAAQRVREPSLGIDAVEFGRGNQGIDRGGALAATVRRDVTMPCVYDARSRFAIPPIRFVDGCHWSLAISVMTVVTI